jgi:large-conductance mechanosensitive channel
MKKLMIFPTLVVIVIIIVGACSTEASLLKEEIVFKEKAVDSTIIQKDQYIYNATSEFVELGYKYLIFMIIVFVILIAYVFLITWINSMLKNENEKLRKENEAKDKNFRQLDDDFTKLEREFEKILKP